MKHRLHNKLFAALGLTAGIAASAPVLSAPTSYSFTGSMKADDVVALYNFYLFAPGTVTFRSYGYAGGTLADGTNVSAGGLDPLVAIFDASGELLVQNNDASSSEPAPCDFSSFDFCLQQSLDAGVYTLAVAQSDNWASGPDFAAGFFHAGEPNFTSGFDPTCPNRQFCDSLGNNRTNEFAFDILGVDLAAVPAPATLALLGTGLLGLRTSRRRAEKA